MTPQDFVDSTAWLLLAWAIGYCAGFLFKVVRQIFENAIGGGG